MQHKSYLWTVVKMRTRIDIKECNNYNMTTDKSKTSETY